MKFSEIVGLQEYFQPVFNIEDETENYWKQFIPNENFYEILNKTLLSVNSSQKKDKLSIWLAGKYGTGKSHATSVIKHLLWDPIDEINDYIEDKITKIELKQKLKAFRKEKRILPIVLKGGGNVIDARTLSLEIERAVKRALKELGITIQVKSDFERIIEKIDDDFLNWDIIISENPDLEGKVSSKDDIVKYLEKENIETLRIIERILSEKNIHFSHDKISVWLSEVAKEIVDKKIANGLMIYWDEFTTILEKDTISEIINEIQSIAELSPKDNVYLYLITHRDYNQFGNYVQENLDKVRDRFHTIQYPMVPITTYQILSSALKKKNLQKWEALKNEVFGNKKLIDLIDFIAENIEGVNVKKSIKDLYPLHPYTVYLSTFLANHIGSTQRSIFNFLFDKDFGFLKFLDNEISKENLLTPDYLWDFYVEEFDSDRENRFLQVLEKYNTYKKQIEKENPQYLKVFKGILLLNSLYQITGTSLDTDKVIPHINNIKKLFVGTEIEKSVDQALEYLDKQEIIQKNPNDLYEISSSFLPRNEIEKEKENLKNEYKNITNIIEFNNLKKDIENFFNEENGILRKTRVKFFSADISLHILKSYLAKYFPPSYTIDFAVFLKTWEDDNYKIETLINDLVKDEDFKHIVFINVQEPLGEDNYNKFIEYLARANVAKNHSFKNDSIKNDEFAEKIIKTWINNINYIDVYSHFLDTKKVKDIKNFGKYVNNTIAPKIFNKGIDTLNITTATVWQFQSAKKAAELVLNVTDRTDLETQPKAQYSYIKDIFKNRHSDYIIDKNLNIKDLSISHALIEIYKQVKSKIDEVSKKASFNIAEELEFLTKPPYGLYTNILNMAVLGYALREYVDKLYVANSGQIINAITMRDKINEIFNCWQNKKGCDKLYVRLGSEEEKELIKELAKIFDIEEFNGIQDIRWKIKDKVKKIGFPLWSVKYIELRYEQHKEIIEDIRRIVYDLTDTEIDIELIRKVLPKIKNNSLDLQRIFSEPNFEKGFKKFILDKAGSQIDENEIDSVINYLRKKLPEQINWKEEKVIIAIKDWIIEKTQQSKEETSSTKPEADSENKPQEEKIKKKVNLVKKKIEKINDVNYFKKKILKLIEERPDIAEIIAKYL